MTKIFKKVIASILVCAITLTSIELTSIKAYAEETVQSIKEEIKLKVTDEEIDDYIDELVDEGRKWEENDKKATTNSITYQLVDGIEKTVFYSDDIRYKDDNGNLVDYDSTLRSVSDTASGGKSDLKGYVYENISGKSKNYFPENISIETPVLSEKDSYSAKISPIEVNEDAIQTENAVTDNNNVTKENNIKKNNNKEAKFASKEEAKLAKKEQKRERKNLKNLSKGEALQDEIKDIYDKKQTKKIGMKYKSKDNKFAYEYISSEQGVKENIILDEVPTSNVFSFSLELNGATAKKDTSVEGISFYNEDEDIVGGIQIPFMNDATGKAYSEDITYNLTDLGEGKYTVDMTVSEEYLKDKHRVYPVTIDPTVTWTGTTYMYDTYVANNTYKNDNFYSNSVTLLRAGMLPSGSATTRSLLHWPKIPATVKDKYISSAKLSLYETGTANSGSTLRAYRVKTSWSKSAVTWNTQPSIDTSYYAGFTTKGTAGSVNTASVKGFIQGIANETNTNYGLMLRNTNETSTSKYVGYYNSRYTGNSAYKPKLEIVYADRPSRPTSVTAASSYIKKGSSLTVSWEGISGNLSYVQYRIAPYNPDTGEYGDDIIPYSSSTKIGTTASGTKTISTVNTLPEGYYRIVVRGVNSNGIAGVGVAKSFVIDSTNPVLSSASISPTGTSDTNYGIVAPTLTWTASDKYFYDIQVSLDGGAYQKLSTSASSKASLEKYITESGKHVISLRARDKAANVSTAKTFIYYYDGVMPSIESGNIIYNKDTNKGTVQLNNVKCGLVGFAENVKYNIIKTSDAAITDATKLSKTASITYSNSTGKFNLSSDDMNLADGIYNVYVSILDNKGRYSDVYTLQLFKFVNASYDGEEVLSSEYDEDNNVVTLSWNEDSNIQSVDVYSRYGEEGKFALEQTVTGAYKLNIATSKITTQADYRLVVNYASKQKLSSAITVVKSEDENEDGTTKISYDMDSIDTDEDGLIDIYEMWELGTDPNVVDTDGDGFNDGYEVMSLGTSPSKVTADEDYDGDGLKTSEEIEKGTNPYLKDSDFDGYNDYDDIEPLKTDTSSNKEVEYTNIVNISKFDKKVISNEDGSNSESIINIYNGNVKQIKSNKKITSYHYDNKNNNTVIINCVNNKYIVNTFTYNKDDEIVYLTHNGFGYEFIYDENGLSKSVKVADRYINNNTYSYDEAVEEYLQTGIEYGNNNRITYEYKEGSSNISKINVDGKLKYTLDYDDNSNLILEKNTDSGYICQYTVDSEGKCTEKLINNKFNIKYYNNVLLDNTNEKKTEYGTSYVDNDVIRRQNNILHEDLVNEQIILKSELISGDSYSCKLDEDKKSSSFTIKDNTNNIIVNNIIIDSSDKERVIKYSNGDTSTINMDNNGRVTKINENGVIINYYYDDFGQLIREDNGNNKNTYCYSYDDGGNIIKKDVYAYTQGELGLPSDTIDYSYDDSKWKDLLTSFENNNITYDETGNPINYRGNLNFEWTEGKNLKNCRFNNNIIQYEYNSKGIRTQKTYNGDTTYYMLDGEQIVKESNSTNTIWYIYNGEGDLIGAEINNIVYYYERNILGDVVRIIDHSGNIISSYSYDAFGNIIDITGNKEIANINPIRYRSYYYDIETGLYYLNNRYYDPQVGRFINKDMDFDTDNTIYGYNLYAYCANDYINYRDDLGTKKIGWNKLGYYDFKAKIFYYSQEAPQKYLGYCDFYDHASKYVLMKLKTVKAEFKHKGVKWRIQLWRGIYGKVGGYKLSVGGEIEIYKTSFPIIPIFKCATNDNMQMQFTLYNGNKKLFNRKAKAWWLTGFKLVSSTKGYNKLNMKNISIIFKDKTMANEFRKNIKGVKIKNKNNKKVDFEWN